MPLFARLLFRTLTEPAVPSTAGTAGTAPEGADAGAAHPPVGHRDG
ncbi:hypothetical protein ACWDQL_05000 [Streptomyces olivaceus]